MTREEHIEKCKLYDIPTIELINQIYDDFESRTCENCKYYNQDTATNYCEYDIVFIKDLIKIISEHDSFGCNKFERIVNDRVC